ncbi:hypothetical protein THAOC_34407 [Thalassiosira oceanica]|uniref:Uncharacterized protein n=1 Tax=Thalassiosira oceanica TaxID=159749 RepID=K0R2K1_THAOC|nr:hypothetical protein THAOC_34407 [Thalassiosira oceanica]|eukprot:EJK46903.1 hypothetical protein THAOC_34407 [Thalassiosira oceanica]
MFIIRLKGSVHVDYHEKRLFRSPKFSISLSYTPSFLTKICQIRESCALLLPISMILNGSRDQKRESRRGCQQELELLGSRLHWGTMGIGAVRRVGRISRGKGESEERGLELLGSGSYNVNGQHRIGPPPSHNEPKSGKS